MFVRRCLIALHECWSACLWSTKTKDFFAMLGVREIQSKTSNDLCERTCATLIISRNERCRSITSCHSPLRSFRISSATNGRITPVCLRSYWGLLCINTTPSSLSSSSSTNTLMVYATKKSILYDHACSFEKTNSARSCCVFLRFSCRGLKTTSFPFKCQHYRTLKPHEPLAPSLSRHESYQLRPSRDFVLLYPARKYALPKGRTITHMSVDPKDTTIKPMSAFCRSLPDFKKPLHHHHAQHDHSTPSITPLDFAAL